MTGITLGGNLPNADTHNGLHVIADELIKDPSKRQVAVCYIDAQKLVTKVDDGDVSPILRIRKIEIATDPDDVKVLVEVMDRLTQERMGMLPLDDDGAPTTEDDDSGK